MSNTIWNWLAPRYLSTLTVLWYQNIVVISIFFFFFSPIIFIILVYSVYKYKFKRIEWYQREPVSYIKRLGYILSNIVENFKQRQTRLLLLLGFQFIFDLFYFAYAYRISFTPDFILAGNHHSIQQLNTHDFGIVRDFLNVYVYVGIVLFIINVHLWADLVIKKGLSALELNFQTINSIGLTQDWPAIDKDHCFAIDNSGGLLLKNDHGGFHKTDSLGRKIKIPPDNIVIIGRWDKTRGWEIMALHPSLTINIINHVDRLNLNHFELSGNKTLRMCHGDELHFVIPAPHWIYFKMPS